MRTAIFRKTKLTCRDIPTHRGHRSRHGHQANHSHKSHSWRHWLFHFHVHSGHHWQTHHDGRRLWSHLKLHLELRFPATDYDWHLSIPGCNGSKLSSPSRSRTCIDCCRPRNLDGESDGTVSTANLERTKKMWVGDLLPRARTRGIRDSQGSMQELSFRGEIPGGPGAFSPEMFWNEYALRCNLVHFETQFWEMLQCVDWLRRVWTIFPI